MYTITTAIERLQDILRLHGDLPVHLVFDGRVDNPVETIRIAEPRQEKYKENPRQLPERVVISDYFNDYDGEDWV